MLATAFLALTSVPPRRLHHAHLPSSAPFRVVASPSRLLPARLLPARFLPARFLPARFPAAVPPIASPLSLPPTICCAAPTPAHAPTPPPLPKKTAFMRRIGFAYRVSTLITYLFPVWTLLASAAALAWPATFAAALSPRAVTLALSGLMLSTGLTLTLTELRYAFRKPAALVFAFLACYILMPALAIALAKVFSLDAGLTGGLVLVGIMSGGQASNLCTYIAGGDTALSVAMTTLTTMSAVVMLPALSRLLLGTVLSVDSLGLARSTAQIVLAPILLGAVANKAAPRAVARIRPALPVAGIAMLLILILGPVARTAHLVRLTFGSLWAPVGLLHVLGGVVGYAVPRAAGASERTAVTTGFETGFKSPVLSFVLASAHFDAVAMRVPSAVSIIVLAPLAAVFAVGLKFRGHKVLGYRGAMAGGGVGNGTVATAVGRWMWAGDMVARASRVGERERRFRVGLTDGSGRVVAYTSLGKELERVRRAGKKVLTVQEVVEDEGRREGRRTER